MFSLRFGSSHISIFNCIYKIRESKAKFDVGVLLSARVGRACCSTSGAKGLASRSTTARCDSQRNRRDADQADTGCNRQPGTEKIAVEDKPLEPSAVRSKTSVPGDCSKWHGDAKGIGTGSQRHDHKPCGIHRRTKQWQSGCDCQHEPRSDRQTLVCNAPGVHHLLWCLPVDGTCVRSAK